MLVIEEWKAVEQERTAGCVPIVTYETELGTDQDGKKWFCRCGYFDRKHKFRVFFDYDDGGCRFLRDEVVYADDYWQARRDFYFEQFVEYKQIVETIEKFMESKGVRYGTK